MHSNLLRIFVRQVILVAKTTKKSINIDRSIIKIAFELSEIAFLRYTESPH